MEFVTVGNWNTRDSIVAEVSRKNFVGIAIGPESDAAIVRVGGRLLQAGRVLPIRGDAYQITRNLCPKNTFAEISRLQLVLFECLEELVGYKANRPNGRYGGQFTTASPVIATALKVPFEGRRQLKVDITCSINVAELSLEIWGKQYEPNAISEAGQVDFVKLVSKPAGTFTGTNCSVYIGGNDNAESWEAIEVRIGVADSVQQTFGIDATTIGEIGE